MVHAPVVMSAETAAEDSYASPAVESTDYPPQTDPTLAHATLTELDAVPLTSLANGHEESTTEPPSNIPQNSGIDEGAANAAAESNWDTNADLSTSQEWVDVSRDAADRNWNCCNNCRAFQHPELGGRPARKSKG